MEGIAYPNHRSGRNPATLRRMQSEVQIGTARPLPSLPSVRPRDHAPPSRPGFWKTVLDSDRPHTHHPHPALVPTSSFHSGHSTMGAAASSGQIQPSHSFHVGAPTGSSRQSSGRSVLPRRIPCPECDASYSTVADLNAHKERHHARQSRPFQCHLCEVGFSQKSHLNQHVRTVHEKFRPHKCPQCDKAFGKKYDLSSHRDAVHANERPHGCEFCNKKFAKRSNLTRHREKLHPEAVEQKARR